jgi:hypothetical protein
MGPFTLGDILSETIGVYRRNALGFIVIAAAVQIPLSLLSWLLFRNSDLNFDFSLTEIPPVSFWVKVAIKWLTLSVLGGAAWILMQGALIHGISEQFIRRPIQIPSAFAFSFRRYFPRLGALVFSGVALMLMWITLLGIPFAIRYGGLWFFILQTASVEGFGPIGAMSRSAALVRGSWSRVAGFLFVSGIVFAIVGGIVGYIVGFIPIAGATIGAIITAPFLIVAHTLLYFDLRTQKDGAFSLEVLASELRIEVEESSGF